LQQDLEAVVNRTVTPWLVVEMHRPMYDKYQDEDSIAIGLEYEFEDLLYEYDVDLVLYGLIYKHMMVCLGASLIMEDRRMWHWHRRGSFGWRSCQSPWIEKPELKIRAS
jgi:hypothetical protein